MSKGVSKDQAMYFGCRLLQTNQLHESVMRVWNDERIILPISRGFAGHHQLVSAILENEGDNKYLTQKGGISYGVRKCYVADETGKGVKLDLNAVGNDGDGSRKLKYDVPTVESLEDAELSEEMKETLLANMSADLMTPELHRVWEQYAGNYESE